MLSARFVAAVAQALLAGYVGFTLWRGAKTSARRTLALSLGFLTLYSVSFAVSQIVPRTAASLINMATSWIAGRSAWQAIAYVSWLARGARVDDEARAPRALSYVVLAMTTGLAIEGCIASLLGSSPAAAMLGLLLVLCGLFGWALVIALGARRRGVRGASTISLACAFPVIAALGNIAQTFGLFSGGSYFLLRDLCLLIYAFLLFLSYLDDGHEPMSIEDRLVAGTLTAVLVVSTIASRTMELLVASSASAGDAGTLARGVGARFLGIMILSSVLVIVLVPRLFRKSVFRPLAHLTGALSELERGEHSELRIDHEDEIGLLTRSFNSMANALATSKKSLEEKVDLLQTKQAEVEDLNDELRRQVVARSRQLSDALAKVVPLGGMLDAGVVIDGRYRIDGLLGQGGMGIVYGVSRLPDSRALALKVMAYGTAREDGVRFAREAEIAAGLDHKNLVGVLDVGLYEGMGYLVMERIDGGSLEDARARFGDAVWALPLLAQIAEGLAALHDRSILHRDLKPANVLLALSGRETIAKISDFGIARHNVVDGLAATIAPEARTEPARGPTAAGIVIGTLAYMAPELTNGSSALSAACDVFAFGVLAYEMMSAKSPFVLPPVLEAMAQRKPPSPPDLTVDVSPAISRVLRQALAIDPGERPTARELASVLSSPAKSDS